MTNEEKKQVIMSAFEKVIDSMDDEELEHYVLAADVLNELHAFMAKGPMN